MRTAIRVLIPVLSGAAAWAIANAVSDYSFHPSLAFVIGIVWAVAAVALGCFSYCLEGAVCGHRD